MTWTEEFAAYSGGQLSPSEFTHLFYQPAFFSFMQALLEHKQMLYVQLSNADLSTDSGRCLAIILQGRIASIDFLPELMQELTKEQTDAA